MGHGRRALRIRIDLGAGAAFNLLQRRGEPERVAADFGAVRIGLADDSYTEVVEGLSEGAEIIVRTRTGQKS